MSLKHTFTAVIENAGGGGAYVKIPFDVEQTFGKKRVKARALIDGAPYRGLLVRMGMQDHSHILIILKDIREKIGKSFGDQVKITLEEDAEARVVELPSDLLDAFKHAPDAQAFFDGLSYTHQKEYVNWINEAKRETTRQQRVTKTIEMLKKGKKEK